MAQKWRADLVQHCVKLVLKLYMILCIYWVGVQLMLLQWLSFCVQDHSWDKEPNTEVTGRIMYVYTLWLQVDYTVPSGRFVQKLIKTATKCLQVVTIHLYNYTLHLVYLKHYIYTITMSL